MDNIIIGIVALGMIIFIGLIVSPIGVAGKYHAAIDACEAELPRNQKCVINAIPDVSNDGGSNE